MKCPGKSKLKPTVYNSWVSICVGFFFSSLALGHCSCFFEKQNLEDTLWHLFSVFLAASDEGEHTSGRLFDASCSLSEPRTTVTTHRTNFLYLVTRVFLSNSHWFILEPHCTIADCLKLENLGRTKLNSRLVSWPRRSQNLSLGVCAWVVANRFVTSH